MNKNDYLLGSLISSNSNRNNAFRILNQQGDILGIVDSILNDDAQKYKDNLVRDWSIKDNNTIDVVIYTYK